MNTRSLGILSTLLVTALVGCEPEVDDGPDEDEPRMVPDSAAIEEYQEFTQVFMQSPCDTEIAPIDNEVHDCQRLVRTGDDGREFGPLVGILPNLEVLDSPASFYDQAPRLVARISNAGSLSGEHGYPRLGITGSEVAEGEFPEGQCLWLQRIRETWHAALISTEDEGTVECNQPRQPLGDSAPPLEVVRQTYGTVGIDEYPGTARWEWTGTPTERGGEHYIGVKCGAGWCAIGGSGFRPRPIPQPAEEPDVTRAIAGWHDAQFLAVMAPAGASDAELTPGPWGVVYPERVPPTEDTVAWRAGVRSASFELTPAAGPGGGLGNYPDKLNLAPGNRQSWVELTWAGDPSVNPTAAYSNNESGTAAPADSVITGPHEHGPARSARWRWHDDDETAWVPCPYYGCCDVEETL